MPDRICMHNCTALRYLFEKIRILIGRCSALGALGRWGAERWAYNGDRKGLGEVLLRSSEGIK